jgi:uncharacterized membrane protein YfcA
MYLDLVAWLQLGAVGALAGLLAGYLGIGGGLVLVPALSWWLGQHLVGGSAENPVVHMAVATSLATMLLTSLSSIVAHQRRGAVGWPAVRLLVPGLLAGAALGALLASHLSTTGLAAVFGIFAMVAGLQLLLGRNSEQQRALPGRLVSSAVALAIGAVSALVGVGGGSMTAPWLMWHGIRAQTAIATAAACGYPIALAGSLSFAWLGTRAGVDTPQTLGYVYLPALLGVSVVSVLTAPLGAALVHASPPQRVRRGFGLVLLLVAWRMLAGVS